MGVEGYVTVAGERGATWERVLGTRRLPVLSLATELVDLRGAGRGIEPCYYLDMRGLSVAQMTRLVEFAASTFRRAPKDVRDEITTTGVPILAAGCSVGKRAGVVL